MRRRTNAQYQKTRGDSCPVTGKLKFGSTNRARKFFRTAGNRVRTYRCSHCGHLHVTSQEYEEHGRD